VLAFYLLLSYIILFVVIVQIKTPFNISDLKTSLALVFVTFLTLSVVPYVLFPSKVIIGCSVSVPSPDYATIISRFNFFSFLVGFFYYFRKNRYDSNSAVYVFLVLLSFVFFLMILLSFVPSQYSHLVRSVVEYRSCLSN
jgi:hypothetical protein